MADGDNQNELSKLEEKIISLEEKVSETTQKLSDSIKKLITSNDELKIDTSGLKTEISALKTKFPKFLNIIKNDDDSETLNYSFLLTEENPAVVSSTTIKSKCFLNETELKAVKFSSELKTIENNVFEGCTELKEIYFDVFASENEKQIIISTSEEPVDAGTESTPENSEKKDEPKKIQIKISKDGIIENPTQ